LIVDVVVGVVSLGKRGIESIEEEDWEIHR
jgi:hypothetical protein